MGEKREELSSFLSNLYKEKVSEEDFNEMKYNKLKNRPLMASVVIAIQMTPDVRGKIAEIEEIEAVACAVQNMHLTSTAYGIGGFWATPKLIATPEMNSFLNIGEKDKCLGLFYMGYPEIDWPKSHRKPLEYVTTWR
jgi:nitroreductase